ncbi:MAG: membrane protein insertase YidC [Candidatus Omnitrophica bacterium]|nr:membrane protein insertase YidC [Candidatus Omnitrophota bacterium]
MKKEILLFVALTGVMLFFYPIILRHFYPSPPPSITSPQAVDKVSKEGNGNGPEIAVPLSSLPAETHREEPEEEITYETDLYDIVLTNRGGSIKEIRLKKYSDNGKPLVLVSNNLPKERISDIYEFDSADLSGVLYNVQREKDAIIYTYTKEDGFRITKKFIFHNSNYSIELYVSMQNLGTNAKEYKYRLAGGSRINKLSHMDEGYIWVDTSVSGVIARDSLGSLKKKELTHPGSVDWVGLKNRHFSIILKPFQPVGYSFAAGLNKDVSMGIGSIPFLLGGTAVEHKFLLYAGPNELAGLKSYGYGFEKVVYFGKLDGICKLLLYSLEFFHKITTNYGASIILLTLAVNIILFPLTWNSMKSMRDMQAKTQVLQPKLARLKEEFKDDPQRMNKETWELYKKYKVNPLGGCLPSILQIPVFFALYQTLINSVELRGARFLWIKDLSLPDAVYHIPNSFNINLLPILMIIMMIVQQRISSTGVAVTEEQRLQQKMMTIFMPAMFGVMFYNLPSGLVLYWLSSTIITTVEQYLIKKTSKAVIV